MHFTKAHAYGNDFLYVLSTDVTGAALDRLAQEMCERHSGLGADGLIVFEPNAAGAAMRLFNADGSRAEVSGNGVRGLGAVLLRNDPGPGHELSVQTEAGLKHLTRIAREGSRQTFRISMGQPTGLQQTAIHVDQSALEVTVLNMGNPQCVVLGPLPGRDRFERIGAALERHSMFPDGTNVEFAEVEKPDLVRILIWERGVGPTSSSGTGSCAALVAAARYGGAAREADVVAPGGPQRVEWRADGVYLTGWAEVICEGAWLKQIPRTSGTV